MKTIENVIKVDGHKASVTFDPDIGMFRGEFLGLAGGADFYAETVKRLHTEGEKSLQVFLALCSEKSIGTTAAQAS